MDGKEAIIADIIATAEKSAAALLSAAEAERDEMLEQVCKEEQRKKDEAIAAAHTAAEAVLSRRKTLSDLEARKIELAAKQKVIDAAFDEAQRKVLNMTDHIYREFIGNLILKYADDGDRVMIAESDAKRLHAEWLSALCAKSGKHLSFCDEYHRGKAGVILVGKTYDKNLTLETMTAALRESALTGAAARLFKGQK